MSEYTIQFLEGSVSGAVPGIMIQRVVGANVEYVYRAFTIGDSGDGDELPTEILPWTNALGNQEVEIRLIKGVIDVEREDISLAVDAFDSHELSYPDSIRNFTVPRRGPCGIGGTIGLIMPPQRTVRAENESSYMCGYDGDHLMTSFTTNSQYTNETAVRM